MQLTLTKKILAPFLLLGLVVLILLILLFRFEVRRESIAHRERALLEVKTGINAIASRIQSGILTRSESFAIEAARAAQQSGESLRKLGDDDGNLRQRFEDFLPPWWRSTQFSWKTAMRRAPGDWTNCATRKDGLPL
ncbi:hypothetical protein [Candidatus Accumulibacter vicinus]|uniref:Uncharacterized protein n=1 Tax=Candidatus Accumulibacter vicinus TaxID=2954382 RepID=A0A084XX12_9PROT|nr:hypothetical protein [Candidatus Accumulibacter vicinus]KFB67006.1 MAG: hypothetical protein CAPSK01_003619 [Candidatus Accumulibacter vicinus]